MHHASAVCNDGCYSFGSISFGQCNSACRLVCASCPSKWNFDRFVMCFFPAPECFNFTKSNSTTIAREKEIAKKRRTVSIVHVDLEIVPEERRRKKTEKFTWNQFAKCAPDHRYDKRRENVFGFSILRLSGCFSFISYFIRLAIGLIISTIEQNKAIVQERQATNEPRIKQK